MQHLFARRLTRRVGVLATAALLAGPAALVLAGCGSDSTTGTTTGTSSIAASSGGGQTITVGVAAASPFVVKVTDASGTGVSGVSVTFAITAGGGSLSATSATTGSDGTASTTYTAGTTAGTATVTATASNAGTATFSATIQAATATACTGTAGTTAQVMCLANAYLATLSTTQRATVNVAFTQANAIKWSNLPVGAASRNGIQLGSLSTAQQTAALALAQSALSTAGYSTVDQLRNADAYLSANGGGNQYGAGLYYVAILGTPSTTGTWMLQVGGHHYAVNITYTSGGATAASITPNFVGVEPTSFTLNGTTYTPLAARRDAIYGALQSLSSTQQTSAKLSSSFSDVLMGPSRNSPFPTQEGVLVSSLSADQQAKVKAAIEAWVKDAPDALNATLLSDYESTTALASTYVAWSGSTSPTVQGSYVRLDGPRVWIEFACQNGIVLSGIHYHTIWRDKSKDYGGSFSF